jgi:hypothetical protein
MKDSKFIELLNLYVDQQIDPADAVLLEEEILRNPARRRTYQQYCRMHRGCVMLQEQSRPQVGVGEKFTAAVAAADEKVVEFPAAGRNYAKGFYFTGLIAAAACVAFVVVSQPWKNRPAPLAPIGEQTVQIAPAPVSKAPGAARGTDYQPVLVAHSLRLNSVPTNVDLAAMSGAHPALGWMNQVQLAPLPQATPAVDFTFGAPAPLRSDQQELFHSTLLPVQEPKEQAAYQFQR